MPVETQTPTAGAAEAGDDAEQFLAGGLRAWIAGASAQSDEIVAPHLRRQAVAIGKSDEALER